MLNTQGAFSYTELMAMELSEYITLISEIGEINKEDVKDETPKTTMEQQIAMIKTDPAIRKS